MLDDTYIIAQHYEIRKSLFEKNFIFLFLFKKVLRIEDFKLLLIIISLYGYFFHHFIGWLPIEEILRLGVVEKGGF